MPKTVALERSRRYLSDRLAVWCWHLLQYGLIDLFKRPSLGCSPRPRTLTALHGRRSKTRKKQRVHLDERHGWVHKTRALASTRGRHDWPLSLPSPLCPSRAVPRRQPYSGPKPEPPTQLELGPAPPSLPPLHGSPDPPTPGLSPPKNLGSPLRCPCPSCCPCTGRRRETSPSR